MEKNRHVRAPHEVNSVVLREQQDVRYWCDKWRCTETQLREAVKHVGSMPSNVEAYLRQRSNARGLENMDPPPGHRLS